MRVVKEYLSSQQEADVYKRQMGRQVLSSCHSETKAHGWRAVSYTHLDVYKRQLYACEDADVTLKLKNVLEKELKENDAERLFYDIEMPLVPVLVNIERNGVLLDTEALKQSSAHFTAQMEQIEKEIYELAGETFNIASPKQVGEVLFDKLKIVEKAKKTKTGQYVTSEEVLESLRHKHPVVEKILEHRGLKKLLGTYRCV